MYSVLPKRIHRQSYSAMKCRCSYHRTLRCPNWCRSWRTTYSARIANRSFYSRLCFLFVLCVEQVSICAAIEFKNILTLKILYHKSNQRKLLENYYAILLLPMYPGHKPFYSFIHSCRYACVTMKFRHSSAYACVCALKVRLQLGIVWSLLSTSKMAYVCCLYTYF